MFTLEQIFKAHEKVNSGADFPYYIKEIKGFGVLSFETWVIDSHTDYYGENDNKISSIPKYDSLQLSMSVNAIKFKEYLKSHQAGNSDYFTFCNQCAETGILKWIVDLNKMTCTYFDVQHNEILIEVIPVC